MGFLVAFDRVMYLTNRIHGLESRMTDITTQKLNLTDTISKMSSQISDIGDPDSPAVKKLEARKLELENLDRQLDVQMQKLQTQLQAAQTERQSADGMLQNNIRQSFSYTAG